MVVGEDANLSAYFFTTYAEASRILAVASESASSTIRDAVKEENDKRNKAAAGAGSGTKSMTKKEIEDEIGIDHTHDVYMFSQLHTYLDCSTI